MSIGYTRAHVDRASLDNKDGPIRFVAATEGRKADGIDLRMAGADLVRFLANPVVLYGHRHGTREDLPIGRAVRVVVDGERLLIDVEFDRDDPFAAEVERKIRAGFMNAVSVGFGVTEWEDGSDWRGGVAAGWEMHELSVVPVGLDADALAVAGRSASSPEEIFEAFCRLARQMRDETEARHGLGPKVSSETLPALVAPEPEPPAPAGLDQTAARALLAAFSPEEGNDE